MNGRAVANHIGLCTADLEGSIAFYTEVFGFDVDRRLPLPDEAVSDFLGVPPPVGCEAVYLYLGDFVLELLVFDRPGNPPGTERPFNEPGLTHLSLSVDDPLAVVDAAAARGATILTRSARASMLRDPQGQLVEVLPMAYHEGIAAGRAERLAGS